MRLPNLAEAEVPSQDKTEQSVVAQVSHMASEYEETDALKSADDNEFEPGKGKCYFGWSQKTRTLACIN